MPRGANGACGLAEHGRPTSQEGGYPLRYACGRAGVHDRLNADWRHVGSSDTWSGLQEWADSVGLAWVHSRDITKERLVPGECLCTRTDCVIWLLKRLMTPQPKTEKGSLGIMATGQSSPLGRYPSTIFQV